MSEYQNPEPPPGGPGSAPPPPNYGGPPVPAEPPKPVQQAVLMLYAIIAIGVINVILSLTAGTGGSNAAGGVIFVALYLWLTFSVRKGANWARITITVLFALRILAGLFTLALAVPALLKIFTVIQLAIQIAILYLLYQRPSTEFFAAGGRRA